VSPGTRVKGAGHLPRLGRDGGTSSWATVHLNRSAYLFLVCSVLYKLLSYWLITMKMSIWCSRNFAAQFV